jgi:hypothetical protein
MKRLFAIATIAVAFALIGCSRHLDRKRNTQRHSSLVDATKVLQSLE